MNFPAKHTSLALTVHAALLCLILALVLPGVSTASARSVTGEPDAAGRPFDGTSVVEPAPATPFTEVDGLYATPVAGELAFEAMTAAIDGLVESEIGVYGVVLMRPDGTLLYARNAETPFVSASLYKLILLADICLAIDSGELAPDTMLYIAPEYFYDTYGMDGYFDFSFAGYETTVQEAMFASGAYSSNVAAKALLSMTTSEELNSTAQLLGLTGTFLFTDPTTTPGWPPHADTNTTADDALNAERIVLDFAFDGQVNITTPYDMARFFQLLMNGAVFNERVSAMIMAILQLQMIDDRFPALLPPDTLLIHKTGNLEQVVHDVGVIYAPGGPVILAAMVEAHGNDDRATQVIQRLALIAFGDYDIPPLTAPVFEPIASPVAADGTTVVEWIEPEPAFPAEEEEEWPIPTDEYADG